MCSSIDVLVPQSASRAFIDRATRFQYGRRSLDFPRRSCSGLLLKTATPPSLRRVSATFDSRKILHFNWETNSQQKTPIPASGETFTTGTQQAIGRPGTA